MIPSFKKFYDALWDIAPNFMDAAVNDWENTSRLSEYAAILNAIKNSGKFISVKMMDLMRYPVGQKSVIGIRHDIDWDFQTCLPMAKVESVLGFQGSYYLLHSARYYRQGMGNEAVLKTLLAIQNLNHEIGLHFDCLHDLVKKMIPVEETLSQQLNKMRAAGLMIKGGASHGSYRSYGAINFEIFAGMTIDGRKEFTDRYGNSHPLGQVKLEHFDLEYEANFLSGVKRVAKKDFLEFFENKEHAFAKLMAHSPDGFIEHMICRYPWRVGYFGADLWIIQNYKDDGSMNIRFLNTQGMTQFLLDLPSPARVVLDIHPNYYGYSLRKSLIRKTARVGQRLLSKGFG